MGKSCGSFTRANTPKPNRWRCRHLFSPRTIIDADEIFQHVLNAVTTHGVEGVTFLGGEPMLQARGLSRVASLCQENEVSVMVFTGRRAYSPFTEPLFFAADAQFSEENACRGKGTQLFYSSKGIAVVQSPLAEGRGRESGGKRRALARHRCR